MTLTLDAIETVFEAYPTIPIDRDSFAHYQGLLERRLLINRCSGCGWWIYPHRPMCPQCWSFDVAPTEVSGAGTLYMFTRIYRERLLSNAPPEPLLLASVEFAEQPGLRYLAELVGCPPHAVRHDMPLRLIWLERDGQTWPAFAPASDGGR